MQDHMVNDLQIVADRLSNQARFVKMIIDKELVVANRKKSEIVAELRRKDFRPFPKSPKAASNKENEEPAEDDGDEATDNGTAMANNDYDYLLSMAIWSLTREKVCQVIVCCFFGFRSRLQFEKLRQQVADKEAELLDLVGKSVIELWNTDLDNFLQEWQVRKHDLLTILAIAHNRSRNRTGAGRESRPIPQVGRSKNRRV